jgi:hypothetical protein
MANPLVRPHMQFYPEDGGPGMHEVWHGHKWLKDAPDHVLTPMYRVGNVDYFVNELVYCRGKEWFIPLRWIRKNGEMWARGREVSNPEVSSFASCPHCTPIAGHEFLG